MKTIAEARTALEHTAVDACLEDARTGGLDLAREVSRRLASTSSSLRARVYAAAYARTLEAITLPNAA